MERGVVPWKVGSLLTNGMGGVGVDNGSHPVVMRQHRVLVVSGCGTGCSTSTLAVWRSRWSFTGAGLPIDRAQHVASGSEIAAWTQYARTLVLVSRKRWRPGDTGVERALGRSDEGRPACCHCQHADVCGCVVAIENPHIIKYSLYYQHAKYTATARTTRQLGPIAQK